MSEHSEDSTVAAENPSELEAERGSEKVQDGPPDGGLRAWSVVFGAWAANMCSFGWINCIGVFQDFYQDTYLRGYSSSTIAWIPSLEIFILFGGGFIVGRIYDKVGPRYLVAIGTFLHVFGLMMASLSTEYYQIILSQGICSPIGISCLFVPTLSCVPTWFQRKRGQALGIVSAGSSLGGVFFPIMFTRLIAEVGFPWAMRSCAFLILALLIITNLTLRSRIPPTSSPISIKDFWTPLTQRTYLMTVTGSFLYFFGLFLPINYITTEAVKLGMSPNLAQYLIPILNSASLFGRIIPGIIADKVGAYNTQTTMGLFSGIITLALWLPASSNAAIIVFAALYGFGSGAFVTLLPAVIAQISPIQEIGLRVGMQFGILSIPALVSNPIGGGFISSDHGDYRDLKIWTGVMLLAGSSVYAFTRVYIGGATLKKKL